MIYYKETYLMEFTKQKKQKTFHPYLLVKRTDF